jgi:hypothetical protein
MRLKSELYKEQQNQIKEKLFSILDIPNKTEFLAYDIEEDQTTVQAILDLIPSIRKYFSTGNITAFTEKSKRPWFSVFRFLIKDTYSLMITDCYIPEHRKKTRKYILAPKTI